MAAKTMMTFTSWLSIFIVFAVTWTSSNAGYLPPYRPITTYRPDPNLIPNYVHTGPSWYYPARMAPPSYPYEGVYYNANPATYHNFHHQSSQFWAAPRYQHAPVTNRAPEPPMSSCTSVMTQYIPLDTCWNHFMRNPTCECSGHDRPVPARPPNVVLPQCPIESTSQVDTSCGVSVCELDSDNVECESSSVGGFPNVPPSPSITDVEHHSMAPIESVTTVTNEISQSEPDLAEASSVDDADDDVPVTTPSSTEADLHPDEPEDLVCIVTEISKSVPDLTEPEAAVDEVPIAAPSSADADLHPNEEDACNEVSVTCDEDPVQSMVMEDTERPDAFHLVTGSRMVKPQVRSKPVPVYELNQFTALDLDQVSESPETTTDNPITITNPVQQSSKTFQKSKKKSKKKKKKKKHGNDKLRPSSSSSSVRETATSTDIVTVVPDPDDQDARDPRLAKSRLVINTLFEYIRHLVEEKPITDLHRLLLDLYQARLAKVPRDISSDDPDAMLYCNLAWMGYSVGDYSNVGEPSRGLVDAFDNDALLALQTMLDGYTAVLSCVDQDVIESIFSSFAQMSSDTLDALRKSFMLRLPHYRTSPGARWPIMEAARALESTVAGLRSVTTTLRCDLQDLCGQETEPGTIGDFFNVATDAIWILAVGEASQALMLLDDDLREAVVEDLRQRFEVALVDERPHAPYFDMLKTTRLRPGSADDLDSEDLALLSMFDDMPNDGSESLNGSAVCLPTSFLTEESLIGEVFRSSWIQQLSAALISDMNVIRKILLQKERKVVDQMQDLIIEHLKVRYDEYEGDQFAGIAIFFLDQVIECIQNLKKKMALSLTFTMGMRLNQLCLMASDALNQVGVTTVSVAGLRKILQPILVMQCQEFMKLGEKPEESYDLIYSCIEAALPLHINYDIASLRSRMGTDEVGNVKAAESPLELLD